MPNLLNFALCAALATVLLTVQANPPCTVTAISPVLTLDDMKPADFRASRML